MKFSKHLVASALAAATLFASGAAIAAATVGQPAPAFSVADTSGKTVNLADFKGKYVVMEWVNPGCPFVVKHYGASNMQAAQKDAGAKGVVWLTVSSTAPGSSDYKKPAELGKWMQQQGGAPSATLMDDDGKIGRAFGAKATPHTFVIDPQGRVIYAGAIDSKPTANPADIAGATNYVRAALAESMAGKPVSTPTTQAYGCSVKYSS
jgi:peroxiredoxin